MRTFKPMPALTVSQPFASLIARGEKWVENRTWETLYRGPLAIHAGKGQQYLTREQLKEYPTGCFLAVVDLVAVVHLPLARDEFRRTGRVRLFSDVLQYSFDAFLDYEHTEGPFCWILRNPRRVVPVQRSGQQGLWQSPRLTVQEDA